MADDIISCAAGRFPLRLRPGTGVPLLICHAKRVIAAEKLLTAHRIAPRQVALLGIGDMVGFDGPADEVVTDLIGLAGWGKAERLQVVGFSAGGFGALLYGALLVLSLPQTRVRVAVFNPLASIWPPLQTSQSVAHKRVLQAVSRFPARQACMERFGNARPWLERAAAMAGRRLQVELFHGLSGRDQIHAQAIADLPCVQRYEIPSIRHMLVDLLGPHQRRPDLTRWLRRRYELAGRDAQQANTEAQRLARAYFRIRRGYPDIAELLGGDVEPDLAGESPATARRSPVQESATATA